MRQLRERRTKGAHGMRDEYTGDEHVSQRLKRGDVILIGQGKNREVRGRAASLRAMLQKAALEQQQLPEGGNETNLWQLYHTEKLRLRAFADRCRLNFARLARAFRVS